MDNIDLFVDHFVIHSESREALILNAGSVDEFKQQLRNLVFTEVSNLLFDVWDLQSEGEKIH